ncbi:hypothetical protein GOQ27_10005 [Clostridium sp. D2Q-11]|uniref:Tail specific protease domain-containing protein n=1 Tax=Anaeromonas frigoriresistens TaxID=2683708 RepID=A0A942UT83_9FIRM|nr:S41 family peptidase [Anaeromonas frigoriresistens]MBS4538799.1 hypothetical protein [Anaeromonas frigoriresistens]
MNKWSVIPIDMPIVFTVLFLLLTIILFIIISNKFKSKRKRIMGIWSLGWLLLAVILLITGTFGRFVKVDEINTKTYSKQELTKDLNQLEEIVMNENPLYFADKDELNQKIQNTRNEINDGMTELDFYRLINPIIADVRCGHTNLYISEGLEKNRKDTAKFFPLKVSLVDDQLYFLEEDKINGIEQGNRIISINGKTTDEIIHTLVENISIDSTIEAKARYIISKHFNSRFYDFVDNSDTFEVEILNNKGISSVVNLDAKYRDEFNTNAWSIHFADYKDGNYYDGKVHDDYAVLDINVFMEEKDNKFDDFLEEFFIQLKNQDISKLIIDLRGNYGADPKMAQKLMTYIIDEEMNYFQEDVPFLFNILGFNKTLTPQENRFDGDISLLTDGAVFSTAGHFVSLIKYHDLATIVGSETGGTYVCTDRSKDTVLPNTRIRLHYSTFPFKVDVEGLSDTKGVEPDIPVSPSIENILNKENIIMKKGLEVLGL